MTYQVIYEGITTVGILRDADGVMIPLDELNSDYVEFLAWNEAQVTPLDLSDRGMMTWGTTNTSLVQANSESISVLAGGDYPTIQAAIDYFKGKIVTGVCSINVEAGTYAEVLDVSNIVVAGVLNIIGDTRALAGVPYINGDIVGTDPMNGGSGTVALARSASPYKVLTVTCGSVAVDFDADFWGAGDTVITYTGKTANTVVENVLTGAANATLTGTNAWGSAVGTAGEGCTIILKPNVIIQGIVVSNVRGVNIQGFYVKPSSTSLNGIFIGYHSGVSVTNTVIDSCTSAFHVFYNARAYASNCVSIQSTVGLYVVYQAYANSLYYACIKNTTSFQVNYNSGAAINGTRSIKSTTGWIAYYTSNIRATSQFTIDNTTEHSPTKNAVGNSGSYIMAT